MSSPMPRWRFKELKSCGFDLSSRLKLRTTCDRDATWRERSLFHSEQAMAMRLGASDCDTIRMSHRDVTQSESNVNLCDERSGRKRVEAASPGSCKRRSGTLWWCCGSCGKIGHEVDRHCCKDPEVPKREKKSRETERGSRVVYQT